jgi:5-formyltetrahydrofolate cyclo-ligase
MERKMKKKLRETLLAKRDGEVDILLKSRAIADHFNRQEFYQNAKTILLYASFGSEVMTDYLLEGLILDKKAVVFPKCDPKTNEILPIKINSKKDLSVGCFGILEPSGAIFPKDEIDIVVVPAICFDKLGHRLGYGKGYYDRFLKEFKGLKIGFCYLDMIQDQLPIERHDINVDMVICESGVLS